MGTTQLPLPPQEEPLTGEPRVLLRHIPHHPGPSSPAPANHPCGLPHLPPMGCPRRLLGAQVTFSSPLSLLGGLKRIPSHVVAATSAPEAF